MSASRTWRVRLPLLSLSCAVVLSCAMAVSTAWGVGCTCGSGSYTCDVNTCNPGITDGVLPAAVKCDWNCNGTTHLCPNLLIDCYTTQVHDRNGDGMVTICGTAGANTIYGTAGDDVICAKGGDDTIIAEQGGNDLIDAGPGNDTVQTGEGDDYVFGDTGNDCIASLGGSDMIKGGTGNDGIFDNHCLPGITCTDSSAGFESPLLGSRLCGGKGADFLVGYGPSRGHTCFDGGADQVAGAPNICGSNLGGGAECLFANATEPDLITFRNCVGGATIFPFGSEDPDHHPVCGCD